MKRLIIFILGLLMFWGANSFAEDVQPAAGEMDMNAKMAEVAKYSQPGENHKRLDVLVGKWNYTVKFQMSPESEPEVSQGTNENKWVLGGRFIQSESKGEATKNFPAFEGMGFVGYDNVKGEYNSVWLDNMGTSIMKATGQFDTTANTLSESGSFSCPLSETKNMEFRTVWKIIDNDHYTYEMFMNDKGKEIKGIEISYERA